MANIYYWREAIGDTTLLSHPELKIALKKIINNNYAKADLEMLAGHHDIFSYRLNKKSRILFTTINIGERRCLLLLDYLPNHKYGKSRFLSAGILKRYINLHKHDLAESTVIEFEAVKAIPEALQGLEQEVDGPAIGLDYHHNKFIQLSDTQERASRVSLPALISGGAGSGKSCVAIRLLINQVEAYCQSGDDKPHTLLYVTQSHHLARAMEDDWAELPIKQSMIGKAITVKFRAYDELLAEHVEPEGRRLAPCDDFDGWYLEHDSQQRKIVKTKGMEPLKLDHEMVFQEFRVCCAYTEENYYGLGDRQTLFQEPLARKVVYEAYHAYCKSLRDRKLIHPAFHSLVGLSIYDVVIVDESQDLSRLQLQGLVKLAKDFRIVFCLDGHQSLYDELSKRSFILQMLQHCLKKKVSCVELPVSYRCPFKITRAAETVIVAKHYITGGLVDKDEPTNLAPHMGDGARVGHVFVVDEKKLSSSSWLNDQKQSAHFAVVTSKQFYDEACLLFPKNRIFMPEDIKGLEYDTVVLFRPFSNERLKKAYVRMERLDDAAGATHRPKPGVADYVLAPDFNQLFTSMTRAQKVLVICEEDKRETRPFLMPLRHIMGDACLSDSEPLRETTAQSWENEVNALMRQGQIERARDVYLTILHGSNDDFEVMLIKQREKDILLTQTADRPETLEKKPQSGLVAATKVDSSTSLKKSKKKIASETTALIIEQEKKQMLELLEQFSDDHTSLIRQLSVDDKGIEILGRLLEREPGNLAQIAPGVWGDPTSWREPDHQGVCTNTSILYHLTIRTKGIDMLTTLLEKAPLRIASIPPEAWWRGYPSPLYNLTKTNEGLRFLSLLLTKMPVVLTNIPAEAWGIPFTLAHPSEVGVSPFYHLSRTSEGQIFLRELLEVSPDTIALLEANVWSRLGNFSTSGCCLTTPLGFLITTETGQDILKRFGELTRLGRLTDTEPTVLQPSVVTTGAPEKERAVSTLLKHRGVFKASATMAKSGTSSGDDQIHSLT